MTKLEPMNPSVSRVLSRYLKKSSGMKVVYALQEFPETWSKAIFLAGPTPRAENPVPSWRVEALELLRSMGYDGVVFVPETEDGKWSHNYDNQIEWETRGLSTADVIVFWVPRDLKTMPAFTTNVEFGRWVDSRYKVVLGHPKDAPKNRFLDALLGQVSDGEDKPCLSLQSTLETALAKLGEGALRSGGERNVPLPIWNTPMFQSWYLSLRQAGNRLDSAEVRWVFMPKTGMIFSWVLWVKVWIAAEDRWKENEWVFSRSDISAVVLHYRDSRSTDLLDSEIVLVKEFRSPARTSDGFIHELPGGSSTTKKSPEEVARDEVREETGLRIASAKVREVARLKLAASRFQLVGSRQVAGTLSSHHAMVFSVRLSEEEIKKARDTAASGEHGGVEEDTERTYVEVHTVRELLISETVDWSNLGMIMAALTA